MSKKNLELKLDSMAFGGEALASHEGKKIFVPWGVAGDVVKAEIVEEKKDFARARILEILEKSPHRTQAPCPYFFKCGGCQWQHVRYESQVDFKNELLKSALQRIGKIAEPNLLAPISAPQPFHYRNKIRLQLSRQGQLGFFKAHSHEVVEIDSCVIAEANLNEKIPEARQLATQLLAQNRAKLHEIEIFTFPSPSPWGEGRGEGRVQVRVVNGNLESFSQVNQAQNEILKAKVLEYLELSGEDKVLELFAGDGNFTFEISRRASSVITVESNAQAILLAEEKIRKGHYKNIECVESSAHRYLASLSKNEKFDRVLLDPPRAGVMQGLDRLAHFKVPVIVYVSCDPATLARDVKELQQHGYRHEFSQLIDMFPQTYHIESITKLSL